jgi:hypothetical protein
LSDNGGSGGRPRAAAQIQSDVQAVVPGAKPVSVERIKIHGKALEGNLEGDAVDREVFVFLPPSYQKDNHRRYPVVYATSRIFHRRRTVES